MDKTNINALVQWVEHSLHLIHKNRFSIKQYQFQKNLAWIFTQPGLKNHTVLGQFVFIDNCGYTFTIWTASTIVFMVGCDRERGRNAKCVTIEDKTWLHVQCIWPWQYHLSSCWCNYWKLHISVSSLYGQGQIWIPASGWSLLSRVPAPRSSATPPPPPPQTCKAYASQPSPLSTKWNRYKSSLKATIKADIFSGPRLIN